MLDLDGLMSRRDFNKHVEQGPPTRFFIIIGIIVVMAVLLAILVLDCGGRQVAR
jgi:hypothetical protein